MKREDGTIRIAAVGDIHCGRASQGELCPLFAKVAQEADVLLLAGDLTNYGTAEEFEILIRELESAAPARVIAVLGNHDYETGNQELGRGMLEQAGVTVLDGESVEIEGVGFAGVKGFVGGFGRRELTPWGESSLKKIVQEAIDESLKLESALSRLRTSHRVVLLHYAPIQATIAGEPLEIAPFLGSSRLEEPIDRYRATVVFHGHAHHGSLEGRTRGNVPVYNVALPLLRREWPDRASFRMFEVSAAKAAAG
ncbi:MAG TPA: metallophosphoesterase [Thermoanaerobaculia bacterium]|nr:metallophosphoesterase [Thermoanaerobaculia bacterium]